MENNKETIDLKTITVNYMRHWRLFLGVFLFSFIPAILYLMFYPRTYEFHTSIQIQQEKESSMASFGMGEAAGLMKSFGLGVGGGSVNIDDEMAILTSNRLLGSVALDLGLNVVCTAPFSFYEMYREAPLKLTAAQDVMLNLDEIYTFKVTSSPDHVKVKVKSHSSGQGGTFEYKSLPAVIKVGGNDFVLDYNNSEMRAKNFSLHIACLPISWTAEKMANIITVEDVSSISNILDVTCSDHSIARGKDILGILVTKYNEDAASYKRIESDRTLAFVNERITGTLSDLSRVELDIQAYKTKNDMTLLEEDVKMYGESMKMLQQSIIETESQKHLIDMLDEYVKNPENKYNVIPSLMSAADGEKKGAISSYNEALIERKRFLTNASESNLMFKEADSKVEDLRKGIYIMIENAQKSVAVTLKDLKQKERQILARMKTIPEKEREYVNFERNREILQGLYLMLLQKREETILSISNQTDKARLIDPAFAKKKPLGPRKLFAAIGMLVLTIVIPVSYLLVKDIFASLKEEYKHPSSH